MPACQTAKAGRRCKGNGAAQDATHVLVCKKGRWVRLIGKADGLRMLAEIQAKEAAAVRGAVEERPPTTEAPATTTTTTTTTTTAPPASGPPGTPAAPTAVRVDDPLGGLVRVSWVAPSSPTPITGYFVYTYDTSDMMLGSVLVGPSERSTNVRVANGKSYRFGVAALTAGYLGGISPRSAAVRAFARPNSPTGLLVVPGDHEIGVLFDVPADNGDPIDGFLVTIISADGGAGIGERFVAGTSVPFFLGGLTNGRTYALAVQACNQGSNRANCSPESGPPSWVVPWGNPGAPTLSGSVTSGTCVVGRCSMLGVQLRNFQPSTTYQVGCDLPYWPVRKALATDASGNVDGLTQCYASNTFVALVVDGVGSWALQRELRPMIRRVPFVGALVVAVVLVGGCASEDHRAGVSSTTEPVAGVGRPDHHGAAGHRRGRTRGGAVPGVAQRGG